MSSMVLRNVAPYGEAPVDVEITDGVITGLVPVGTGKGEVIHAFDGDVLLPGLVDLHTHLREPGREDAETILTGSQAAALGGFTAVHAMANTNPVADTAGDVELVWRAGIDAGYCDVRPVGAVTVGLAGERLAELGAMADSAAKVRVFSDDGKCVSDALLMRRALEYVKAFDGVVAQHAQEPRLTEGAQMNEGIVSARLGLAGWPAVAEEAIIARDVLLAEHVGSRLHVCHLSTAGSVEIIRWAKSRGIAVTAEVTPHHLVLTDELAATYSAALAYVAGPGQVLGDDAGQLPVGYAPLTEAERAKLTAAAAALIERAGEDAKPQPEPEPDPDAGGGSGGGGIPTDTSGTDSSFPDTSYVDTTVVDNSSVEGTEEVMVDGTATDDTSTAGTVDTSAVDDTLVAASAATTALTPESPIGAIRYLAVLLLIAGGTALLTAAILMQRARATQTPAATPRRAPQERGAQ